MDEIWAHHLCGGSMDVGVAGEAQARTKNIMRRGRGGYPVVGPNASTHTKH